VLRARTRWVSNIRDYDQNTKHRDTAKNILLTNASSCLRVQTSEERVPLFVILLLNALLGIALFRLFDQFLEAGHIRPGLQVRFSFQIL